MKQEQLSNNCSSNNFLDGKGYGQAFGHFKGLNISYLIWLLPAGQVVVKLPYGLTPHQA